MLDTHLLSVSGVGTNTTVTLRIIQVIISLIFFIGNIIVRPTPHYFLHFLTVIHQSIYKHDRANIILAEFPAALLKKGIITENWNLKNLENLNLSIWPNIKLT